MTRIMIIGCGGAGKSTLSRKIHSITKLPLIHLDQLFWKPNWGEPDKEDWARTVDEVSDRENWIIDGNYGGTMEIRLRKATTILFLNRSRWLCLRRVLYRQITGYGKVRDDMGADCPERFSWDFLKYVYHYNQTRRPKILKRLDELKHTAEVQILSTEKEVTQYVNALRKQYS